MPSPVGHALGGLIFGWLVHEAPSGTERAGSRPRAASAAARLRTVALHPWTLGFAMLGALADADLAFGIHSRQSHSIGAVAVVFLVAASWGGRLDLRRGLACGLAYGSHVLFDWVGTDTTPPIGIMALWPFSDAFHQSNLFVFDAIWRSYWRPGFWAHNAGAVLREIAILAPFVLAVWWARRARRPAATSLGPGGV